MTYSEYKDCGIDWIGEIPVGWEVKKLKFTSKAIPSNIDKNIDPDELQVRLCNYTDVYYNEFISSSLDLSRGSCKQSEYDKLQLLEGDVILTKDSETADDIGVPAFVTQDFDDVVCGYHLTVVRPLEILGKFLFRFIQYHGTRKYFEVNSEGITRWGLGKPAIENLIVPLPPLQEQKEIVDYLDNKTEQIDLLIEKTDEKIAILKEQRIAIINQVVTKGLDPDAEMKDSEVDWIGEIPVGWEVKKLKFTGWLYGGLTGKSAKDFGNDEHDNNQPYIPFTNIADNRTISMEHFDLVAIEEDETQNRALKNDIFFLMSSEGWEDLGKASILVDDVEELYLNSFCKGFRITDENVISTFVNYQLSGDVFKELLSIGGNGFTRINLRQEKVKNLCLLLPPLQEQKEIVDYLDNKTEQIDSQVEREFQRIELLKEYRNSLISEVVTGQIDVRGEMVA